MTTVPRRRRGQRRRRGALLVALGAAAGAAVLCEPAGASGKIYGVAPDQVAGQHPFFATGAGVNRTANAPAGYYLAGSGVSLNWTCRPGSEIAYVTWVGHRTGAPSSLEAFVTGNGARVWAEPDVLMPMAPHGRRYMVHLPTAACRATLRLNQTESRTQHARFYAVHDVHVGMRDLTPPSVTGLTVPGGWLTAAHAHANVGWHASDNFGSEGMGLQQIAVAGVPRWSGLPGPGSHGVAIPIGDVPDGQHNVTVQVDGDGTAAGIAAANIHIDRTPPGVAGMAVGYTGRPGRADLAWTVDDPTSGVRSSHVEVNVAGDGSQAAGWVEVALANGAGSHHLVDVDLSGVPDGVHAWRVRTHDIAGNIGYVNGPGPIVVDTTPPALVLEPLPLGYVSELPLAFTVVDQLQGVVGVGPITVLANTAPDGGTGGDWTPLRTLAVAAGRNEARVPLVGLSDGRHAIWIRAQNGPPFGSLVTDRFAEVKVDRTPPSITGATFELPTSGRLKVSWIADDALSGLLVAVVQWREGAGPWRTLGSEPLSDGAGNLTLDISALPPGGYDLRLLVADKAGNVAQATPPAQVQVDHTPPIVESLRVVTPATATIAWRQSDPGGGFGACPTVIEVSGAGTGNDWKEILSERLGGGEHVRRLPLRGLVPGDYRVRVVACDAAGNQGSATIGPLQLEGDMLSGAASTARDPFARVRSARLTLAMAGARVQRRRGAPALLTRRVRFGTRVMVTGRLLARNGRPIAASDIEVRGAGGRVVGRARTRANGRFRVAARPDASGGLRVGVPAGDRLLPRRANRALRVRVRPLVSLKASTLAPAVGAPVVFSGRIRPAPRQVRGPARKVVVLEWRDPLRGTWRPVVNARARADGRFRVTWRFALSNITIPMRVRVPAEGRWPLVATLSRQLQVTPRGV